jgi:hypothetical protein
LLYLGDNGFERLAQLRYGHDYTLYGTTSIKLTFKLDSEHMRKTHELARCRAPLVVLVAGRMIQ